MSQLANGALLGDRVSERELVEQLAPSLRRFLVRQAQPSIEDADDALQESLLVVLANLPNFRGESGLLQFSLGVARRLLHNRRRAARRHTEGIARAAQLELPLQSPTQAPQQEDAWTHGRRLALAELVAELPEVQARTLALRVLVDLSLEEVAAETNASVNTVRTRLRLARNRLRSRIESDARLREILVG